LKKGIERQKIETGVKQELDLKTAAPVIKLCSCETARGKGDQKLLKPGSTTGHSMRGCVEGEKNTSGVPVPLYTFGQVEKNLSRGSQYQYLRKEKVEKEAVRAHRPRKGGRD